MSDALPEHVLENRRHWDQVADAWIAAGERGWKTRDPHWGCWHVPDSELGLLPSHLSGRDVIELGCGTAYFSAWMARRGARVVGVDSSARQLDTARRLAQEHQIDLTLHHGSAESVPWPDASFDLALSEYGAAIWCDPYVWIPEAHRLLRPGGELVFLGTSPLVLMCRPPSGASVEQTLHRDYFGLHRIDWRQASADPGGIEFNLPLSAWLRLFRETGFDVLDFHELVPPPGAVDLYGIPAEWARCWPAEQAWKLRKR